MLQQYFGYQQPKGSVSSFEIISPCTPGWPQTCDPSASTSPEYWDFGCVSLQVVRAHFCKLKAYRLDGLGKASWSSLVSGGEGVPPLHPSWGAVGPIRRKKCPWEAGVTSQGEEAWFSRWGDGSAVKSSCCLYRRFRFCS